MSVKLRIATIRLYNKCQKNPDYSKKIGITTAINNCEIRESSVITKIQDSSKQTF